jgi:Ca2+-binding RTX toxin-like protein
VQPKNSDFLSQSLVFIDSSVDDVERLVSGVNSVSDVFILHPCEEGVAQITAILQHYTQVSNIHIVSHGSPGSLTLGNTALSLDSLDRYVGALQQWRQALAPNANVLLYGCNVAYGDRGRAFIHQLKEVLNVAIAASSTPIGNAKQGGNWQLDVMTDEISVPLAFRPDVMAVYPAVLVDTFINEDFSDASGSTPPAGWTVDVLAGDPAIDTWRFDNPGNRTLPDFLTNPVAIFDSDNISNNDQPENVALVSPVFNASAESQVFLEFKQEYLALVDPDYGSEGFIEVFNGTNWVTVSDQVTSDVVGTTRLDISQAAAGVANAQVRFRWTGNWSYRWSVDDVKVVDALTPGVTISGNPQVSEDNVPDPLNFQFVLDSKPTANVTFNFTVDNKQLQSITPLTFTPDNWNIPQVATVRAVADGITEGNDQKSPIGIKIVSSDPIYGNLKLKDAIATITDNAIPGYISYRTVEKTLADVGALAANNSDIAKWVDIGDSYDKATPGGPAGYDIYALELTNKSTNPKGGKPVLYVEGGIHSREYSTNEVATRFAEYLVNSYGVDPDVSWLLDYFKIVVTPVVNPDGRKLAEQGYLWRKNTNPNPPAGADPAAFPNYGVDLNRNHSFEWGEVPGGSSGDPASETYRGDAPASEPETQAVENYVKTLFPDQRGPGRNDAAPNDATGVFIDLHSYGNTVLYPWGSTSEPAPNREGLRNLGLKFGYYTASNGTPYDVYQSIGLYPTDGTTDDWAYGTLGVAGYTWELGTDFFEPSDYFEKSIAPQVVPALLYAAKSAYRPYQTSGGPDSVNVSLSQGQVVAGHTTTITLTATADDTRYADSNNEGLEEGTELPEPKDIVSARYSIDAPSWISGTKLYELTASDGKFDESVETLKATIDTTGLAAGRHTLFVESKDADGQYGVPTAVFLDVLTAPAGANVIKGSGGGDTISGTGGIDVIYGKSGSDKIRAKSGNDIVIAGSGNDDVRDGSGDDLIYGGAGNDYLDGSTGNDKIYGEDGSDRLFGYDGDDLLWGGKGNDTAKGGRGQDTFAIALKEGTDTFQDFKVGEDLVGLAGRLTFGQLSISQDGQSTLISFNKEVLAKLSGVTASALTESSFVTV